MNMKKLLKPMVIAAAATMAFSATAFAGTSSPYSLNTVSYTHLDVYKRQSL